MSEKRVDSELSLEVDEAILEYLIYTATENLLQTLWNRGKTQELLEESLEQASHANLSLQLVDSFLTLFQRKHLGERGSQTTRFRLLLLKLVFLFSKRHVVPDGSIPQESLRAIRVQNKEKSRVFPFSNDIFDWEDLTGFMNALPVSEGLLRSSFAEPLEKEALEDVELAIYDSPASVSLLDTLPLFMAVSAAQIALQWNNVTKFWMRLAARYMAEAVLEQVLVYKSNHTDSLREAFSYGFSFEGDSDKIDTEEPTVMNLFWSRDESKIGGWEEIRREQIRALLPPEGVQLQSHLEILESNHLSFSEFDRIVTEFLEEMLLAQQPPILVQLESGSMEGMSMEESRAFKDEVLGFMLAA